MVVLHPYNDLSSQLQTTACSMLTCSRFADDAIPYIKGDYTKDTTSALPRGCELFRSFWRIMVASACILYNGYRPDSCCVHVAFVDRLRFYWLLSAVLHVAGVAAGKGWPSVLNSQFRRSVSRQNATPPHTFLAFSCYPFFFLVFSLVWFRLFFSLLFFLSFILFSTVHLTCR